MGTKKERIYGKGAPQRFGGQLPQTALPPWIRHCTGLYIWINCKSSRGPSFTNVNCTSATSYHCDATMYSSLLHNNEQQVTQQLQYQCFFFGY